MIVGFLYTSKIISGRVEGGKARILIYFILIFIFLCNVTPLLTTLKDIAKYLIIIIVLMSFIFITVIFVKGIIFLIIKCELSKYDNKNSKYILNYENNKNINNDIYANLNKVDSRLNETKKDEINKNFIIKEENEETQIINNENLKTIYELWDEKDESQKCLTITNDENCDLKWVKIYKPPYSNGKFYGYIMMQNAHNTVNGEIYFAEKPIWRLC